MKEKKLKLYINTFVFVFNVQLDHIVIDIVFNFIPQ